MASRLGAGQAKYAYTVSSSKYKKIKGLPRHKKYYVRVRSYVKKNGNVYYSKWSSRKAVKRDEQKTAAAPGEIIAEERKRERRRGT